MKIDSNDLKWLYSVTYDDCKLIAAEINYSVYEKKLLAIKYALQIWRIYINNDRIIIIYTDYESLKYLITMCNLLKCLTR